MFYRLHVGLQFASFHILANSLITNYTVIVARSSGATKLTYLVEILIDVFNSGCVYMDFSILVMSLIRVFDHARALVFTPTQRNLHIHITVHVTNITFMVSGHLADVVPGQAVGNCQCPG